MTTTTNLNPPRARWYDLPTPVAAALVIFFLLLIGLLIGRVRSTPAAAMPTPAIIIIASPLPQGIPPTAVPAAQVAALPPNVLRRAVVAYDSPNGGVIGAIESGRTYAVVARWGSDWLQADVSGSGVVWLKADQVLDLPDGLVDLQPAPQPAVVYVSAPAYAAPTPTEQTYTVMSEPPAEPTPAVRAEDFKEPDPKAACAFVGCLHR